MFSWCEAAAVKSSQSTLDGAERRDNPVLDGADQRDNLFFTARTSTAIHSCLDDCIDIY